MDSSILLTLFVIFVFGGMAIAITAAIVAIVKHVDAELRQQAADRRARDAARAAVVVARENALWRQAEQDLALSCPTRVGDLPCSGLGAPIRDTNDRYRCPVCGGQFVGAPHGW